MPLVRQGQVWWNPKTKNRAVVLSTADGVSKILLIPDGKGRPYRTTTWPKGAARGYFLHYAPSC